MILYSINVDQRTIHRIIIARDRFARRKKEVDVRMQMYNIDEQKRRRKRETETNCRKVSACRLAGADSHLESRRRMLRKKLLKM